jgi:hypothetical protein
VSWRHTCPHPVHRYRRIVTSRVVGRQPSGSCASSRVTVSRGLPAHPQRRHQPSVPSSASRTRHARTARSGSRRWPTTTRPSSSRRQNVVRSGQPKAASDTSRSSRWAAQEPPSSEDLDTYPGTDAPATIQPATTPSTVKSQPPPTKEDFLSLHQTRPRSCSTESATSETERAASQSRYALALNFISAATPRS